MPTVNYSPADMETTSNGVESMGINIGTLVDNVTTSIDAIDKRVVNYFTELKNAKNQANNLDTQSVTNFKSWYDGVVDNYNQTVSKVNGMTPDLTDHRNGDGTDPTKPDSTDPTKYSPYTVKKIIDKLTPEEQTAVVKKLKELGYTDEEIKKVLEGEFTVNKYIVDAVTSEVDKLTDDQKAEVSKYAKEKYGFDIFDKDGNIDPDKLALILEMDGKDPNDDYDFIKWLKEKYGIEIDPFKKPTTAPQSTSPDTVTPYTPAPTTSPDTTSPTAGPSTTPNVHNGETYTGALQDPSKPGNGNANQDTIDDIINGDSEKNGKDGSLIDGLATSFGKIIPKGGIIGGDGSSAGGAATAVVAGLGAAAVAAGGGLLIKKKMDENGEDEDEKEDDELEKEENEFDEEMKQMEEDKEEAGNRDWLYGLGIGLAGAGIAAGLMGDDDDDEDEEDDDDIDLL